MRVLVIEDDEMTVELLKRSLKAAGKQAEVATNGQEGYEKASTRKFDAIIMDVMLPEKNGLDICRELRKDGVETPIIFLSSRDSALAKKQGIAAGANDYMTKPFVYEELDECLRNVQVADN